MTNQPTPACDGQWPLFYALIDNPGNRLVLRDARALCGSCPIAATCLRDNRDESWARAVMGKPVTDRVPGADPARSANARKKWDAKRAARLDNLRELIALGVTRDDMPAALDMSAAAFKKWCANYARDEWRQLLRNEARRRVAA